VLGVAAAIGVSDELDGVQLGEHAKLVRYDP
jgi:hypothetical protein